MVEKTLLTDLCNKVLEVEDDLMDAKSELSVAIQKCQDATEQAEAASLKFGYTMQTLQHAISLLQKLTRVTDQELQGLFADFLESQVTAADETQPPEN